MKNSIFTKFTWILALCAFMISSTLYVACTKDVTVSKEETSLSTTKESENAALLDQADQFGQTAYEHLKLNFLSHKAEDYINPMIREKVMQEYNKAAEEMKNLSTEECISKNLADKKLSEKQATYFRSLLEASKELDGLSNFKDVETALNGFDQKLLADKDMPSSDKQMILNTSASIRRTIDYTMNVIYQPLRGQLQTRDFCVFGKKFSCVGSIFVGGMQIAVALGAATVNPYAVAAGIVSSIIAVVNIFTGNNCDCSTTGSSCYSLYGVSLFRAGNMDCSGNFAKFCAWGDGPSPSSFEWNLVELDQYDQPIPSTSTDLPDTPDQCANFSPDVDIYKKFRLTVTTSGTPNCNNGAPVTKSFDFTWNDVAGDAGTVLIEGPTNAYRYSTPTYSAHGTFLANPKNTFSWNLNLSQMQYVFGNVVLGGGNNLFVNINWTTPSCGYGAFGVTSGYYYPCYQVGVGGKSTNSCSGYQKSGYAQVAVRN